ncbi:probable cyclic nucleotide-gated ion channel 16 [Glycine soja]|uniref:Putative cyclic nucleotide-gated ion channel 16 n=1 Tax=Glycine soja TaxID=3848 RepID=A0A445KBI4_GLYSO|nr:probable cyclic nucleotide-gated ion channel 16 [Glycine soja]RZC08171.1 putative cyclic nucleotide-gated ion channel 16 [Glycine soja]
MSSDLYRFAVSSHFSSFPKSFSLRKKVPWWYQILDPRSRFVARWNRTFLYVCIVALFLDPLYFYFPITGDKACMQTDIVLGVFVTFSRTIADLFFLFHMVLKFRTAFVSPLSSVYGRKDLVTDPRQIASRYLRSDFAIDLFATLPLPQIVIWFVIPAVKDSTAAHVNHTLSLIVLIQFIPRLFQIFPLQRRILKTSGLIAKTALAGALYNLGSYMLASHVLGASWYVSSIQRQYECWIITCKKEMNRTHSPSCNPSFLDCGTLADHERQAWFKRTRVLTACDALNDKNEFQFGMFADAFTDHVSSSRFFQKYFYCLWWGLKNLSSYGQNLQTSTYSGETLFSSFICIAGLILFAHLIGNMQNYLQSSTAKVEEWRLKQKDTEEWMNHRQLPPELQQRVRRFVQYKWLATRGVDEEAILRALPLDLRRQIQRHLCLDIVRRVPFFGQMDDQLLDAICERLVSSLNTKDTYIVREGDPVREMLFIIRGQVESSTTDGGRTGFFNSITLRPGDFCGEELLTWALMPSSTLNLPSSTQTVKTLTEVEAFALRAEDLKFVASQFKRLHSKKLQHAFRYYSHQWRAWGAHFIQAAWRRHRKRKLAMELLKENLYYTNVVEDDDDEEGSAGESSMAGHTQNFGATFLASKFAANTKKGAIKKVAIKLPDADSLKMPKMFKPTEPDFSTFHD